MGEKRLTFTKPKGVKYTDMCIWIDKNIYREYDGGEPLTEEEKEKCFQYLYLIAYMLASKRKFFIKWEDYDEFALFFAANTWMRLTSPKQFLSEEELKEKGYSRTQPLTRIKSVLNNMKAALYGNKIQYQQQYYQYRAKDGGVTFGKSKFYDSTVLELTQKDTLIKNNNEKVVAALEDEIKQIPKLIKEEIADLSIKDKEIKYNIYMSILLTFVDSLTAPRRLKEVVQCTESSMLFHIAKQRQREQVKLWHLDSKYENYVRLVYRKVNENLLDLIKYTIQSLTPTDKELDGILNSAYVLTPISEEL